MVLQQKVFRLTLFASTGEPGLSTLVPLIPGTKIRFQTAG